MIKFKVFQKCNYNTIKTTQTLLEIRPCFSFFLDHFLKFVRNLSLFLIILAHFILSFLKYLNVWMPLNVG